MPDTGNIHVTIVDGRRQPLAPGTDVLVRLLNGAVNLGARWAQGSSVRISDIPFTDTGRDAYNVFAHAKDFEDTVTPNRVALKPGDTAEALLMAIPKDGAFHFQKWDQFRNADANIVRLLSNGATDAGARYQDATDASPMQLGALINLATAINDIPLTNGGNPLRDFYWEVIWDMLAPDRFWAWVDKNLIHRIEELAALRAFAKEPDSATWHPAQGAIGPATNSWKQTRFDVANVQLTFHETNTSTRNGVDCVVVEPDIDLFRDPVAHGLTEVIPNLLSGNKTDPRAVYMMRWMASRQDKDVPEFSPPLTIE
jgi:hypothetical protein